MADYIDLRSVQAIKHLPILCASLFLFVASPVSAQTVSQDAMAVAKQTAFQERVSYFMQKAAIAVMAETLNVECHTERVTYSGKVLDGSASVFEYSIGAMTNTTVAAAGNAVTDNDLEFAVNSMFNAFAECETGPAS